jgi:hypothetical protein
MSFAVLISSLINDSNRFLQLARNLTGVDDELIPCYCRAVYFSSWSALEGWINYISYILSEKNPDITLYEKAFLKEKSIEVDENGKIIITNRDDYKPTLKKLLFIMNLFSFDLKHNEPELWRRLKEIENKRNNIVHPKNREDYVEIDYKNAEDCYTAVEQVINLTKKIVFG